MSATSPRSSFAGRLFYLCYHQPRTWLQDRNDRAAGRRGDQLMRTAAFALPPTDLPNWGMAGPACRFLTGTRFVHQTIFCARSFEQSCVTHVRLEIFNDGTLGRDELAALQRTLPHARLVAESDALDRLDRLLPRARFPHLRQMRDGHPLMRKLLDLHAGLAGPALYLDSDMLFFGTPTLLQNWLRSPRGEWYMHQSSDALVGSRTELSAQWGKSIPSGVNTGIVAVENSDFDWDLLESFASFLSPAARSHPWAEQTLFAMYLGHRSASPLPDNDYVLCNNRQDLAAPLPALRHYVDKSKALYAATEWRRWLAKQPLPVL